MTVPVVRRAAWQGLAALAYVCCVCSVVSCAAPTDRSDPPSPEYEDTVRAFYQGLAALDVGLLEDAEISFERAAALSPDEPAIRANLAVAHVGFGNDAAAAVQLEAARTLAPDSSELAFLQGQLAGFDSRFDDARAYFRETLALDPTHVMGRFALAQQLAREEGGDDLEARSREAQQLFESLLVDLPGNLAVLVEHLRLAAERSDAPAVADTIGRLRAQSARWPDVATTQLDAASTAADAGDFPRAGTLARLLRNVLVRMPAFRKDQAVVSVSAELIAEPLRQFLDLPAVTARAAPRDATLTYLSEPLGEVSVAAPGQASNGLPETVTIVPPSAGGEPTLLVGGVTAVRRAGVAATAADPPFPSGAGATAPTADGVLALDWNGDYRMDLALAGAGGVRLFIQDEDGQFAPATPAAPAEGPGVNLPSYGAWAADTEMDGDLDLVVGAVSGAPWVLRNNADGSWRPEQPFPAVEGLRGFVWGDLDRDGDPDAVLLDAAGVVHAVENMQGGAFQPWPTPNPSTGVVGLTMGDLDADGWLDLVTLTAAGELWRHAWGDDGWTAASVAQDAPVASGATVGSSRVMAADLDNNGALDLVVSGDAGTALWLSDEQSRLAPLDVSLSADVFGVVDLNADGWLDLVGTDQGVPVRLLGRGSAGYGWQEIRPRAHIAAGDQRINAFGVGGEIEVRAGLLVQRQVLTGAPVHVGLGAQTQADVTRIYWPNGVMQADFAFGAGQVIVAEQRLKGSCPWVFAYDGHGMHFVTDFLWRSPLGLRINAQDTADIAQTEDWVLIRGDQLAPRDGAYDLRVTAELWETHFFDHVSLLVVDHPPETEVHVDERFARESPALQAHVSGPSRTVRHAWDDLGADVSALVQTRDERYVSTFERGSHQGVTRDHYLEVELDLPADGGTDALGGADDIWLLANGWVYPTDSSINLALGQGRHAAPRGVALEALDEGGRWVVLHPDLGFPAGKRKTMVVAVPRLPSGRVPERLRLRTNLEVYWDWIGHAPQLLGAQREMSRLAPTTAMLDYRGYSRTELVGPRGLEIPRYDIANVRPRWRDLTGYHTRFGDVRELLVDTDDRYVIMNAGDEMRFRFTAPGPPPAGWRRDFVLIGDGWVKDGDFNTTHSKTVGPLPAHDRPIYSADASTGLEDDPVYQRHPDDWVTYHTRYVAPDRFLRGLGRDTN
jgi:tetratricopeptide (TPR) repeat protein